MRYTPPNPAYRIEDQMHRLKVRLEEMRRNGGPPTLTSSVARLWAVHNTGRIKMYVDVVIFRTFSAGPDKISRMKSQLHFHPSNIL